MRPGFLLLCYLQDDVDADVILGDQLRAVEGLQLDIEVGRPGEGVARPVGTGQKRLVLRKPIVLRVLRHVAIALVVGDVHHIGVRVAPLVAGLSGGLRRRLSLEYQRLV